MVKDVSNLLFLGKVIEEASNFSPPTPNTASAHDPLQSCFRPSIFSCRWTKETHSIRYSRSIICLCQVRFSLALVVINIWVIPSSIFFPSKTVLLADWANATVTIYVLDYCTESSVRLALNTNWRLQLVQNTVFKPGQAA